MISAKVAAKKRKFMKKGPAVFRHKEKPWRKVRNRRPRMPCGKRTS